MIIPGEVLQVPLSALEHYAYCSRQAALILLEDAFADDASTVRGTLMHQRVHEPDEETRPGVKALRALPVWHDGLGLTGVCDVVEILDGGAVIPIEHKSGPYKADGPADVQVAAQAICLEERFQTEISTAFIYSGADRRRHQVTITTELRRRVVDITEAVRLVMHQTRLPAPPADQRCRGCSMHVSCMPKLLAGRRRYDIAIAGLFYPTDESDWDG